MHACQGIHVAFRWAGGGGVVLPKHLLVHCSPCIPAFPASLPARARGLRSAHSARPTFSPPVHSEHSTRAPHLVPSGALLGAKARSHRVAGQLRLSSGSRQAWGDQGREWGKLRNQGKVPHGGRKRQCPPPAVRSVHDPSKRAGDTP